MSIECPDFDFFFFFSIFKIFIVIDCPRVINGSWDSGIDR